MTLRSEISLFVFTLLCIVLLVTSSPSAYAHGHEDHDEAVYVGEEVSAAQMEQLVELLKQVVALLTQYRAQYGVYTPVSVSMPIVPLAPATPVAEIEVHVESEDADDDHGEHAMTATPAPQLVIEVEPHSGMTHVHVRYTDKPEEMFFVEPGLDDEDGIVAAIVTKTGLSAEAARAALKYMQ